jgi:membrane-associated protease RseP (regulator of RpoE activity)
VEPGSPAAAGGLRAGDAVVAMDGTPVGSASELTARVGELAAGSVVSLRLDGAGGERTVELSPAASPVIVSLNQPGALDPALAARLASLELSAEPPAPAWVLRLNRGVLLMRSGEWRSAAEALRGIQAPASAGVGRATVDYLLGVALLEVDRATYRDTALGLIGRAADVGGRLEHNDGPLLAPRARARLGKLVDGAL